jgi:hypothetical protein
MELKDTSVSSAGINSGSSAILHSSDGAHELPLSTGHGGMPTQRTQTLVCLLLFP